MSDFEPTQPLSPLADVHPPVGPPPAAPQPPVHEAAWLVDPWNAAQRRYWDGRAWTGHTAPVQTSVVASYRTPPVQPHPTYPTGHVQPYGYSQPMTVVMTDANPNGVHVAFAWVFTVLTLGYMLPWAIAASRGKSNALAIGLLNFLLGWTFLGWLAALVMACGSHQSYAVAR
jgi:hypothetical protein